MKLSLSQLIDALTTKLDVLEGEAAQAVHALIDKLRGEQNRVEQAVGLLRGHGYIVVEPEPSLVAIEPASAPVPAPAAPVLTDIVAGPSPAPEVAPTPFPQPAEAAAEPVAAAQ